MKIHCVESEVVQVPPFLSEKTQMDLATMSGWWFGTFFDFSHHIGNNHPNWLIFFKRVETAKPDVRGAPIWSFYRIKSVTCAGVNHQRHQILKELDQKKKS
jgi:hypothetical protein